ncbi:MAG: hypothetical protein SFT94_10675 [Pseudanabaenaceae cyanobacterium bins.68]|nr:hypothetical protein [Pseudanabaenaceae cyanobacterium bins.68]
MQIPNFEQISHRLETIRDQAIAGYLVQIDQLNQTASQALQNFLPPAPPSTQLTWLVSHPLQALFLGLLLLSLLSGLFSALSKLSEQLWLFLLRAPFQLIGWLFSGLTRKLAKPSQK